MSDWDTVTVLRKKAPKAGALKTEAAINAARRQGVPVDTQQKCKFFAHFSKLSLDFHFQIIVSELLKVKGFRLGFISFFFIGCASLPRSFSRYKYNLIIKMLLLFLFVLFFFFQFVLHIDLL